MQRSVCNSSWMLSRMRVLSTPGPLPPMFATMTLFASVMSCASRCAWRFATVECITGPKRPMTSKNDLLECEGSTSTSKPQLTNAVDERVHRYSSASFLRSSSCFARSALTLFRGLSIAQVGGVSVDGCGWELGVGSVVAIGLLF